MNSKFGDCCNCPALVDGRFFTEYRDRDALQFNLMKTNNLTNSNAFRNFLITNGTNLMNNNLQTLETNYKCNYQTNPATASAPIDTSKFISGQPLEDLNNNKGTF